MHNAFSGRTEMPIIYAIRCRTIAFRVSAVSVQGPATLNSTVAINLHAWPGFAKLSWPLMNAMTTVTCLSSLPTVKLPTIDSSLPFRVSTMFLPPNLYLPGIVTFPLCTKNSPSGLRDHGGFCLHREGGSRLRPALCLQKSLMRAL